MPVLPLADGSSVPANGLDRQFAGAGRGEGSARPACQSDVVCANAKWPGGH